MFSMLMGTIFSFLLHLCFLGASALLSVTCDCDCGLLPQLDAVGGTAAVVVVVVLKFLVEKSLLSLEYLTTGEVEMVVVVVMVVLLLFGVRLSLCDNIGRPAILLCRFT